MLAIVVVCEAVLSVVELLVLVLVLVPVRSAAEVLAVVCELVLLSIAGPLVLAVACEPVLSVTELLVPLRAGRLLSVPEPVVSVRSAAELLVLDVAWDPLLLSVTELLGVVCPALAACCEASVLVRELLIPLCRLRDEIAWQLASINTPVIVCPELLDSVLTCELCACVPDWDCAPVCCVWEPV